MLNKEFFGNFRYLKTYAIVVLLATFYYTLVLLKVVDDIFILDFIAYIGLMILFIIKVKGKESKDGIIISCLTVIPFFLLPHGDLKEFLRLISLTALISAYLLVFLKDALYHKPIIFVVLSMVIILFLGTIGVYYYENLTLGDAFWVTFISATTVGYGDVVVSTEYGRLIIIFIIISGTLVFGAILTTLVLSNLQKSRMKNEFKRNNKDINNRSEKISYLFEKFRNGELTLKELEDNLKLIVRDEDDRSKKSK